MAGKLPLTEYRRRRDFRKTGEPRGKKARTMGEARFVVQEHDASTLHYDLRLEIDGVLKSWAVPKGPSTDPRDKRLAVPTEDHPLDYVDFEGVIPEGQYGAGAVIVWDAGTFRDLAEEGGGAAAKKQLEKGHISFWLEGEKLRGGYALTRVAKGKDARWLLVKMDDEEADARRKPVKTQPRSVLTGRTVREVAAEEGDGAARKKSGKAGKRKKSGKSQRAEKD